MSDYTDWLDQDDPRYECIDGCPRLVLPQGLIHSADCRDTNWRSADDRG